MHLRTGRNVIQEDGDVVSEIPLGGGLTFSVNWSQAIRAAHERFKYRAPATGAASLIKRAPLKLVK